MLCSVLLPSQLRKDGCPAHGPQLPLSASSKSQALPGCRQPCRVDASLTLNFQTNTLSLGSVIWEPPYPANQSLVLPQLTSASSNQQPGLCASLFFVQVTSLALKMKKTGSGIRLLRRKPNTAFLYCISCSSMQIY